MTKPKETIGDNKRAQIKVAIKAGVAGAMASGLDKPDDIATAVLQQLDVRGFKIVRKPRDLNPVARGCEAAESYPSLAVPFLSEGVLTSWDAESLRFACRTRRMAGMGKATMSEMRTALRAFDEHRGI